MKNEKTFKIVDGDVSDGFHTFKEIYEHRKILYIYICLMNKEDCYWAYHFDWDSIVLVWNSPHGQISYHVSYDLLNLFKNKIEEKEFRDHEYDGHTSEDVLERLKYCMGRLSL